MNRDSTPSFRAETEEELEQIKALRAPEMEQAITAYYKIAASPEFRELDLMREKAFHDEQSLQENRPIRPYL